MPKKAIYVPPTEAEFVGYFNNVAVRLPGMASKYSIQQTALDQIATFNGALNDARLTADTAQAAWRAAVQEKSDLFSNAREVIKREFNRLNNLPNFDEKDALELGMRKTPAPVDPDKFVGVISDINVMPDKVVIDWVKGKSDGIVIHASFDGVTFEEIGIDLRSPFEDTRKNRTPGVPERRHYKIRCIKNDMQVGQFSDVAVVVVMI